MNTEINIITINGVEYIEKSKALESMPKVDYTYCIIRTYSAGVFAGFLKKREGKEVILTNARRLWYWEGAFTLSEMAMDGVSKPNNCKFSKRVSEIIITEAIEIIPTTIIAQKIIESVKDHITK